MQTSVPKQTLGSLLKKWWRHEDYNELTPAWRILYALPWGMTYSLIATLGLIAFIGLQPAVLWVLAPFTACIAFAGGLLTAYYGMQPVRETWLNSVYTVAIILSLLMFAWIILAAAQPAVPLLSVLQFAVSAIHAKFTFSLANPITWAVGLAFAFGVQAISNLFFILPDRILNPPAKEESNTENKTSTKPTNNIQPQSITSEQRVGFILSELVAPAKDTDALDGGATKVESDSQLFDNNCDADPIKPFNSPST